MPEYVSPIFEKLLFPPTQMEVVEDDVAVPLVVGVVPAPPFGKTLLEGPGVLIVDEGRLPCPRWTKNPQVVHL